MAVLKMKTSDLLDSIGSNKSSAGIKGCIADIQSTFAEINNTALKLNDAWNDDAQKNFMKSFDEKHKIVMRYLSDLDSLINEISVFSGRATDWDIKLHKILSDKYLNS